MHREPARARLWLATTCLTVGLAACGGGSGPDTRAQPQEEAIVILPEHVVHGEAEAARFLAQASYGATTPAMAELKKYGYRNWIERQFNTPRIDTHWDYVARQGPLKCLSVTPTLCDSKHINAVMESFWQQAITGPDQLRQRMVFALSQIFVVSTVNSAVSVQPDAHGAYLDTLSTHAFGNFRDLLEAVTRHPAMGLYLSHMGNQKENPTTGQTPDENYAREVMQLFTIGLWELDEKGRRRQLNGQDIPTYGLDDVMGMARVLTGLSWGDPDPTDSVKVGWWGPTTFNAPMTMYPQHHSQGEKKFLGVTIPARSGTATKEQADDDLRIALDALFNHANTPAFISRQLIKRFVTSNPSDDYVGRVADAFRNNGFGVRGDLKAVIRAILLDPEARNAGKITDPQWGKLREPVVRYAHFLRAFNARSPTDRYMIWNLEDPISSLGQNPQRAPSVFNWYQPEYRPPGELADANVTAPEFQITHETTLTGYQNFMTNAVERTTANFVKDKPEAFVVDYSREIALAENPTDLINHLDVLLMNGQMSTGTRQQLLTALNTVNRNGNGLTRNQIRVHTAITLLMGSPEYIVQK